MEATMHKLSKVALILALTACSNYGNGYTSPGTSGTGAVTLGAASFAPSTVYPDAGGLVTWTWNTSVTHNITFETAITGSGDKNTGTFAHTFTTPGTYRFRCTIHSTAFGNGMSGSVIVPDPGTGGGTGY
jgi:plastocyanin